MNAIHPEKYFVGFTGKYSELKDLGFSFQRLYASNYMQWNSGWFRVWKRGGDITCDRVCDSFPVVFNLLSSFDLNDLPFQDTRFCGKRIVFYVNTETFDCTLDSQQYRRAPAWESHSFTIDRLEPLLVLMRKGWVSLKRIKAQK